MIASALALATAAAPQAASADGDPASDVLIGQSAFLPWDAGAAPAQQARLVTILGAAARTGYPIRVAVIASQSDLGSVTALWRRPELYARFLDQELSLEYKGPVLIVMPNGVGLASAAPLSAAARSAVAAAAPAGPIGRARLVIVADTATEKLAAASGHALPASMLTPTAPDAAGSRSSGAIAYAVLAVGAVLIALAWVVSFRARPPHALTRRRAPG
jgi:hypothetical protein